MLFYTNYISSEKIAGFIIHLRIELFEVDPNFIKFKKFNENLFNILKSRSFERSDSS